MEKKLKAGLKAGQELLTSESFKPVKYEEHKKEGFNAVCLEIMQLEDEINGRGGRDNEEAEA